MNQDQIKGLLLQLAESPEDFHIIFTGKTSRKVDGLYRPESREIIIHSKNHKSDRELIHTAIHEYAHHLQFCESPVPITSRAHTSRFWSIFHSLLYKAEELGLYESIHDSRDDFRNLTAQIAELVERNGQVMKELGVLLLEAHTLCLRHRTDYGDYVDRALRLPRALAHSAERDSGLDLDTKVGFENMKTLARIKDNRVRAEAASALTKGGSPDMLKAKYLAPAESGPTESNNDAIVMLKAERNRIQRSIDRMQNRLSEVDRQIDEYADEKKPSVADPLSLPPGV